MNPVAEVELFEQPGPPPRRHLNWRPVILAIIIVAALALTLFMCVPSRFGVSPG